MSKVYRLEYGRNVWGMEAKKGTDYHVSKPLTEEEMIIKKQKLEQWYEYVKVKKVIE